MGRKCTWWTLLLRLLNWKGVYIYVLHSLLDCNWHLKFRHVVQTTNIIAHSSVKLFPENGERTSMVLTMNKIEKESGSQQRVKCQ